MDGKDAEGLQQTLALFRKYDTEGKGHLSPDQFTECLANTSLGLSAADVDVLLDMADADEDDRVSYEEFAKMAFDVLLYLARERAIIAAAEKEKKAAAAAATSVQKATRGRQARDEMKRSRRRRRGAEGDARPPRAPTPSASAAATSWSRAVEAYSNRDCGHRISLNGTCHLPPRAHRPPRPCRQRHGSRR